MGTVTVVNCTETAVNASLSAAVNYDWRNRIGTNEYVVLDGGVGLVTLNVSYWVGPESEYHNSATEIGLFAAGTVIALAGVALAAVTFGGSLWVAGVAETTLATLAFGASTVVAAGTLGWGGIGIGAIIIAVKDFGKTAAKWSSIYAPDNKKFKLEGGLVGTADDHQIFTITRADPLKLTELTDLEFQKLILAKNYVEKRDDPSETNPVGTVYATRDELTKAGLIHAPTWIYPSFCGVPDVKPARWEFQSDKTQPGTPVQLWNRDGSKVLWEIQSGGTFPTVDPVTKKEIMADVFVLYNASVGGYASVTKDELGSLVLSDVILPEATFHLVKTLNCVSFVPFRRPTKVLVTQKGHTGNGTKIVLADRVGPHPGWARWVVDPVHLNGPRITKDSLKKLKMLDTPIRIYPAVALRHPLPANAKPACWEVDHDATNEDASIQISGRDVPKVDWQIVSKGKHGADDIFAFYNPTMKRYVKVSATETVPHVRATLTCGDDSLFFIGGSMGYLSFFPLKLANHAVYAEGLNNGAKLRAAEPGKLSPALARWVVRVQPAKPATP